MRRPLAVSLVALALVAGAGTGVAVRSGLTRTVGPPTVSSTSSVPVTPRPSSTPTATPTTTSAAFGRDNLLPTGALAVAGWGKGAISATVADDQSEPVVSPCQRTGPFSGLDLVTVGRWTSGDRQAAEVVAEAPSAADARRRAEALYEQHLGCAELPGRTVGDRHAVTVDGGSITWFEVTSSGHAGFSSVVRQSNRFAVVYVDAADVSASRLPTLLRAAATQLR